MPTTPTQKTTRSSSNPNTNITLLDIKTLIESSKKEILSKLKTEVTKLTEMFTTLSDRIDELERRNTQLEQKYTASSAKLEEVNQLQAVKEEKADELLKEMEERIHRRDNIIISGVPELSEGTAEERKRKDCEIVQDILNKIVDEVPISKAIYRLGRPRPDRARPIRVVGLDASDKANILRKSRSLKRDTNYGKIYVNPDLTPRQQKEAKELRDELKMRKEIGEDDIVIYRGKIVKTSQIQNFR